MEFLVLIFFQPCAAGYVGSSRGKRGGYPSTALVEAARHAVRG